MAKNKGGGNAAGTEEAASSSQSTYPRPAEISHEEAAKLVKRVVRERKKQGDQVVVVEKEVPVTAKEVFAVNEYADHYNVVTTDGQKLVADK